MVRGSVKEFGFDELLNSDGAAPLQRPFDVASWQWRHEWCLQINAIIFAPETMIFGGHGGLGRG